MNDKKYELIVEKVNNFAVALKELCDIVDVRPADVKAALSNPPKKVTTFASKEEATEKKEKLEKSGVASYSIMEAALEYKLVVKDFDIRRDSGKIAIIMAAIRDIMHFDMHEIAYIVQNQPTVIKKGLSLTEANKLEREFAKMLQDKDINVVVEADL